MHAPARQSGGSLPSPRGGVSRSSLTNQQPAPAASTSRIITETQPDHRELKLSLKGDVGKGGFKTLSYFMVRYGTTYVTGRTHLQKASFHSFPGLETLLLEDKKNKSHVSKAPKYTHQPDECLSTKCRIHRIHPVCCPQRPRFLCQRPVLILQATLENPSFTFCIFTPNL